MELVDSIHIARPVEEVFAFVSDYGNDVRWREGVLEMSVSGRVGPGMTTREKLEFLGSTYVTDGVVTSYDRNRVSFRGASDSVEASGSRVVEPAVDGTTFTYSLALEPRGALRWFLPILRPLYAARIRRDLKAVKALLEQGPGGAT